MTDMTGGLLGMEATTMNASTIEEMKAEILALRGKRDKLLSLEKDQAALIANREKRTKTEERKEAMAALAKSCRNAIKRQMDGAAAVIAETVKGSLPADWDFELVLADGTRDAFWPGLWQDRGGRMLTTTLSGSEDATVLGAFSALAAKSRPGTLSVLVPDDVGWDPTTLFEALKGFHGYPGQILLCATTWPGRLDEDGEIIDDIPSEWSTLIMPDGITGT